MMIVRRIGGIETTEHQLWPSTYPFCARSVPSASKEFISDADHFILLIYFIFTLNFWILKYLFFGLCDLSHCHKDVDCVINPSLHFSDFCLIFLLEVFTDDASRYFVGWGYSQLFYCLPNLSSQMTQFLSTLDLEHWLAQLIALICRGHFLFVHCDWDQEHLCLLMVLGQRDAVQANWTINHHEKGG